MKTILVTGSAGLIGGALAPRLAACGYDVRGFDVAEEPLDDVRDRLAVLRALSGCDGVVHLAAVSRVVWGERNPGLCWAVNAGGTANVLDAARAAGVWAVVASSREVYGQADILPVAESAQLRPCNIYGHTKVAAEGVAAVAREMGTRLAVVRFSNVYGSAGDHPDRVVPAFARAALRGEPLRVEGGGHLFDFTHVEDVARGLVALVGQLDAGAEMFPTVHLVSGVGTTLSELAALAVELTEGRSAVVEAPPRDYDVARFVGDPERAGALLGWRHGVDLRSGLVRLIADLCSR